MVYYITDDGKERLRRRRFAGGKRWDLSLTEYDALELVSNPSGSELTRRAIEEEFLDPVVVRALDGLVRKGLVGKDE